MSGKKNLHEGDILYFSLKVCEKTGTKSMCAIVNGRQFLFRNYESCSAKDEHG